jgi:hypothetical protein
MTEKLTFNKWSMERIEQGRKICTSRTRKWEDDRVYIIIKLPLKIVRDYLYKEEGANSPEEFESVWKGIFRGRFNPDREVYVHFGDFKEKVEELNGWRLELFDFLLENKYIEIRDNRLFVTDKGAEWVEKRGKNEMPKL